MRRAHFTQRLAAPLLLLTTLLTAAQPLLRGWLPQRADGLLHFYRLLELEQALRHGVLFPRWLPDMGYGYGFPLFHYYPPLSYYLLLPLRAVGMSTAAAYLIGYALALLLTGVGVYLWLRDFQPPPDRSGSQLAGITAAAAAACAPYILINVYHRGAYAEAWGVAWLSLSLWAAGRLAQRQDRTRLLWLAGCYAALLLSHNILALSGTPLLLGYGLLAGQAAYGKRALWMLAALLLGLGLAAFFWLPAFLEQSLVQLHKLFDVADFDYRRHFLNLSQLLSPPRRADFAAVNPAVPFSLGWPQLLLAAISWRPSAALPPAYRRARALFTAAFLLLVFLTLPISEPLWAHLPLLALVQLPWRILGPASLCLACLAGLGAWRLTDGGRLLLALALMLFALPWLFPARFPLPPDPSPAGLIRFEVETGFLGTTSVGDYLPVTVASLPDPASLLPAYEAIAPDTRIARLSPVSLPAGARLIATAESWLSTTVTIDSPVAFTAQFYRFAFPGWRAWLDGEPAAWRASEPHGLVTVEMPAGSHTLRLAWQETPLRRAANAVSLFALGLALFIGWCARRQVAPPPAPFSWRLPWHVALAAVLSALALLALKTFYLDDCHNLVCQTRLSGQGIAGAAQPLQVNFDNQLRLSGVAGLAESAPADSPLHFTLYWQALPPVRAEYSVAVHLLDDEGRRYGQSDNLHPAGYPVTRWGAGQYGADRHELAIWPGAPPGEYTLMVQVYQPDSGQLLAVLDAAGSPVDVRFPLGQVTLTPPARWPDAAALPIARRLDADLGGGVRLLGVDGWPQGGEVGQPVPFTLYWQAVGFTTDVQARLRLVDASGRMVATLVRPLGRAAYPPPEWPLGAVVRDAVAFWLPAQAEDGTAVLAGAYTLRLDLVDAAGAALPAFADLGSLTITAPTRSFAPPAPAYPLSVTLGETATLVGYDLDATVFAPGAPLPLTLYWQSVNVTTASYTVFVQLIHEGRVLAQRDQLPLAGSRPTTGWLPGEYLADSYTLTVPADAPPGTYELIVGLYVAETGERLRDDAGNDAIPLLNLTK